MSTTSLEDIKTPKFWLAILAELLGTFFLVLVGAGSCARFKQPDGLVLPSDLVQISLCFGFSIATIVWFIAHVSGGHINPAVTVGFLVTRKISFLRALFYVASQMLGAVAGAGILFLLSPAGVNENLGNTTPGAGVTLAQTFFIEMLITSVLVWTVFATCDSLRNMSGSGPLAIGLSIAMCHLWAIPYTGSGMNPARAFGSAVMSGYLQGQDHLEIHAMYWIGPLVGGALAALLYDLLFAANASLDKAKALFTSGDYDDSQFDEQGPKSNETEYIKLS